MYTYLRKWPARTIYFHPRPRSNAENQTFIVFHLQFQKGTRILWEHDEPGTSKPQSSRASIWWTTLAWTSLYEHPVECLCPSAVAAINKCNSHLIAISGPGPVCVFSTCCVVNTLQFTLHFVLLPFLILTSVTSILECFFLVTGMKLCIFVS